MSKIFLLLFIFFISILNVFSNYEDINLIKRKDWGANENYRYKNSISWKNIIKRWEKSSKRILSDKQEDINKKRLEKTKSINSYLINIFGENNDLVQTIENENGHSLAWNIQKTKYVKAIVIHHTLGEYKSSKEGINAIYKYHSINRAWGDIGYNYVIGYDGEIYEGRAGGDYSIGAHTLWNNRSTVGISIMGNYEKKPISKIQYDSLDKLLKYLTKKYGIDLSKKYDYHRECFSEYCKIGVSTYKDYTLIGHKDAGITSCPGDELYKQIQAIRKDNISYTSGFEYIPNKFSSKIEKIRKISKNVIKKLEKSINGISDRNKLLLISKIEEKLDVLDFEDEKYYLYYNIKEIIISYFKKEKYLANKALVSFDKTNKINVKLSYPEKNFINIKVGGKLYKIERKGKYLLLKGEKKRIINVKSRDIDFLEIISWDRIPAWDTKKKYNDNKFRGDLIVYAKDGKMIVINRLFLFDYLKGLGEISNSENIEKIRTIIIAARTYARHYITNAEKFPNEFYQASDDPKVFQKYLGYSLEERSPNINSIVSETLDTYITYKGKIIKPWYFSSSSGYTKSFDKFCENSSGVPDCERSNSFPFLQSVKDPGGIGKKRWGHGLGIPGTGVKYFAERGWTHEMIIKYFLKGVELNSNLFANN